jgi:hypothetical protein
VATAIAAARPATERHRRHANQPNGKRRHIDVYHSLILHQSARSGE